MIWSPAFDVGTHAPKSQRGARGGARWRVAARATLLAALLVVAPTARAIAADIDTPERTGSELLGLDTPLGRFDYQLGRGLRLGQRQRFAEDGFGLGEPALRLKGKPKAVQRIRQVDSGVNLPRLLRCELPPAGNGE